MAFEPAAIRLREGPGDQDWTTLDDLHWVGEFRHKTVHLVVPQPFETDLASVPRVLTWLIPRYGRYTKAAVLHDYYCTYFKDEHLELLPTPAQVVTGAAPKDERTTVELQDRSDADELFRWTMRELGVVAAGYVAQGRWDRGPAYLGAVALAAPALPLAVPLATILVFLFLVWLTVRDPRRGGAPPVAPSAARQRRLEAVQAS